MVKSFNSTKLARTKSTFGFLFTSGVTRLFDAVLIEDGVEELNDILESDKLPELFLLGWDLEYLQFHHQIFSLTLLVHHRQQEAHHLASLVN